MRRPVGLHGRAPGGCGNQSLNADYYEATDLVAQYMRTDLRPAEAAIFDRYRRDLSGRVLEIGCGAGRLTGHLAETTSDLYGIDISAAMVEHCRRSHPGATFRQVDMRRLGDEVEAPFDVLVASFNVLDAVGHADRERTLDGFRRALVPGGLLIMSSHNLGYAPNVVGPGRRLLLQLRSRELRGAAKSVVRFPRRELNHRRLRRLEERAPGYAILHDLAHDYALLHHYASSRWQTVQLTARGFELLECIDLDGAAVEPGDSASHCPELHYVARLEDRS